MAQVILALTGITKEFPGIRALDGVTLSVTSGTVHALCGENGAGKSTLMKILSGLYSVGTYQGEVLLAGEKQAFQGVKDAETAGIAIIYQELALVPALSIAENLFLGREPLRHGCVDWNTLFREAQLWLERVGLGNIDARTPVGTLGIGQQQLVEIAKALSKESRILILDEPTAALTEEETSRLLGILRNLREQGITCLYVSHKLGEVLAIADAVTVFRDGKTVASRPVSEWTESQLVAAMVGRELTDRFPKRKAPDSLTPLLAVKDWTVYQGQKARIKEVSFTVGRGEIVGVAGLVGAGRTELAMSLFGAYGDRREGQLSLEGTPLDVKAPADAIRVGIALVSEDRKRYGLLLEQGIRFNLSLAILERLRQGLRIHPHREQEAAANMVEQLRIKAPSQETKVGTLSGGNQQKVVLGKWLLAHPKLLILDEPTRGIDVGAKSEIYRLMAELTAQGIGILMISSELPEILGMSDRILVMREGRLVGEFPRNQACQEALMHAATGAALGGRP